MNIHINIKTDEAESFVRCLESGTYDIAVFHFLHRIIKKIHVKNIKKEQELEKMNSTIEKYITFDTYYAYGDDEPENYPELFENYENEKE